MLIKKRELPEALQGWSYNARLRDGSEVRLIDSLVALVEMQNLLQKDSFSNNFREMPEELKPAYIRDMVLACTDELHEALNEVGWKPWASSRHVNLEAFRGELIDALHFLLNLFLLADLDAAGILDRYLAKNERNAQRQEEGYDGVSGKCPSCKRALDDGSDGDYWFPYCSQSCAEAKGEYR